MKFAEKTEETMIFDAKSISKDKSTSKNNDTGDKKISRNARKKLERKIALQEEDRREKSKDRDLQRKDLRSENVDRIRG